MGRMSRAIARSFRRVATPLLWYYAVAIAVPVAAGVAVYGAAVLLLRGLTRDEIDWARRALALSR